MLVQPSQTATECEVDLVRKTTRLCDRAQTLDTEKPAAVTDARLNLTLDPERPHVRIAQRSLALRPEHSRGHLYVTCYTEGFSHFVTSKTAPVASGWSGCRVGLAPTGKRRLVTAHTSSGHSVFGIRWSPLSQP